MRFNNTYWVVAQQHLAGYAMWLVHKTKDCHSVTLRTIPRLWARFSSNFNTPLAMVVQLPCNSQRAAPIIRRLVSEAAWLLMDSVKCSQTPNAIKVTAHTAGFSFLLQTLV